MLVALSGLIVVIGLMLLPAAPLAGVLVALAGGWIFTKASGRSEDVFMAMLMVLGGLGGLALFGQYLLQRLNSL
jgi:hypothetical protein